MAAVSLDLATTFLTFASRPRVRTAVLPLLWRPKAYGSHSLNFHSFPVPSRRIVAVAGVSSKPQRDRRRFSAVAAQTTQSEGSDVLTKIPPDDRIPATIITGFLGSGKVTFLLCSFWRINMRIGVSSRFSVRFEMRWALPLFIGFKMFNFFFMLCSLYNSINAVDFAGLCGLHFWEFY